MKLACYAEINLKIGQMIENFWKIGMKSACYAEIKLKIGQMIENF